MAAASDSLAAGCRLCRVLARRSLMIEATWLDRAIGAVAPRAAVRRVLARQSFDALTRGYDGAARGRRTDGWRAPNTSADAEIAVAGALLRDRMRDLVRNNPHAAKAVSVLVNNIVGAGIIPRAATGDEKLDRQADRFVGGLVGAMRRRRSARLLRPADACVSRDGRGRRGAVAAAPAPLDGWARRAVAAADRRDRPAGCKPHRRSRRWRAHPPGHRVRCDRTAPGLLAVCAASGR